MDVSWSAHSETLKRYFGALGRSLISDEANSAAANTSEEATDQTGCYKKRTFQDLRQKCPNTLQLAHKIYNDREAAKLQIVFLAVGRFKQQFEIND